MNLQLGTGTVQSGTFSSIDWGNGPYFVETAADVSGGTSYVTLSTTQFMSVPYALYEERGVRFCNVQAMIDAAGGSGGDGGNLLRFLRVYTEPPSPMQLVRGTTRYLRVKDFTY